MVMLVIPSREDIPEYKKLKHEMERLITEINSTFGSSEWQPVEYLYRTMPFEELAALYQRADVAFITPIRDGMNLVAKEYVASQLHRRGVLVLSETAGAADELKEAIRVNPTEPEIASQGTRSSPNAPERRFAEANRCYASSFTTFHRTTMGRQFHGGTAATTQS